MPGGRTKAHGNPTTAEGGMDMANISSAYGKLTLEGNWTEAAVDALKPVLDAWEFYGEYGMRIYEYPTVDKTTIEFNGCGRWSFSGTLSSFDSWTRSWIADQPERNGKPISPLTTEQYDLLLQLMHDNDLSMVVAFEDVEEGCGVHVRETGAFTSNGEGMDYETFTCEDVVYTWKDMGSDALDAAVDFFCQFIEDPDETDEKKIKKWVKANITPTKAFEDIEDMEDLEDITFDYGEFLYPKNIIDFERIFSPDVYEAWEALLDVMENMFGPIDDDYAEDDEYDDEEDYDDYDEDEDDEEEDDDGNDWDDEPQYPMDEIDALEFAGKAFVLTGEFQNCDGDRDKVQELIVAKGGRCTGSVSGKTNYLVLGDFGEVGAKKVEKALEQREKGKDIKIIIESDLFRFL